MPETRRTEARSGFRKLIQDAVPEGLRTRVMQLMDAVVFSAEPILRGLEHFEVRYGSGAPTTSDFPEDGYGLFIDQTNDQAYVVLQWRGDFFVIGGSGAGSLPAHTHSHLTEITNVGTNTHAQIDTALSAAALHIADVSIHFTEASIDHTAILNIGTNTHAQIDTHIADVSIHFTEASIDHTAIQNIGTNTHAQIDTHIADSTIHFTEGSIDHGSISGLGDDDHTQYLLRDEWLQNGFVDYSDVDIAWDDGSMTLEISPAVTSFQYYYDGILYTETGTLDATITDTEGLWVFYIGSGGAASLSTIHNPSYEQVEDAILNQTIVAYVYWDAANNDGRLMVEMHGSRMSPATHHYLHELFGAQYNSGLALGDILADQNGSLDTHAQFSCTAGRFYDEDLEHDTLARASTDTWECYYVDGSGYVRWVDCEATFPVYAIGGVIAYNNAGTLTAVTSNKYCLYHVFATNIHGDDGSDYYPVVTPGIAVYNSKAEAQDAAAYEISQIDLGDWPAEEVIPIATVIYHHGASMTNGVEAAIQSTEGGDDFVDWRFTAVVGSSTTVNDHGALSGLADDDHTQYLLASDATDRATFAANWTDLTDAGDTNLHGHDVTGLTNWPTIDYSYVSGNDAGTNISAAELEELSDGSETALHIHDSRYYTETEIDNALDLYLPLTAGSGEPLTGDLYVNTPTIAAVILSAGGTANQYVSLSNQGAVNSVFKTEAPTGNASIFQINPTVQDGTSACRLRFLRGTNSSGTREVGFYVGDGTNTTQHYFNCGNGDANLCQQGGQLTIGGGGGSQTLTVLGDGSFTAEVTLAYLGGAPASLANGMIWMESDGLHIYYAGAEKVVAGV